MTCCADDIAYNGFICIAPAPSPLAHGDWAVVEAKMVIEPHALYRNPGPVLYLTSVTPCPPPEEQVASFY
jgi:uncharacterized membrane protein YcgQ (UPF0703/DUF1980 family)